MGNWLPDQQSGNKPLEPFWDYKTGMPFVTVLPDTSRELALLTGELDPTGTWQYPVGAWVHEFKNMQGQYVTVVCNKWNEACPWCLDNEIYKLQNPNYKETNGRLPRGISKKAVLMVWDFQFNCLAWLMAGKQIQDGVNFLLQRQTEKFHNAIFITRMGQMRNTVYRVDLSQNVLTPQIQKYLKENMWTLEKAQNELILSHQEVLAKTGTYPPTYFQQRYSQFPQIDISGWGSVPVAETGQPVPVNTSKPVTGQPVQVNMPTGMGVDQVVTVPQSEFGKPPKTGQAVAQPAVQIPAGKPANVAGSTNLPVALPEQFKPVLAVQCTVGVYKGNTLDQVIIQTGKPYIQYLLRSGSKEEKDACKIILDNWDVIYGAVLPF